MNALVNTSIQSMTSLEISELVEKRHDNVKRTIESLVNTGVIVQPQIEDEQSKDAMGRTRTTQVYIFTGEQGKRDSIIVVAQLCPEFTARLVDRWQELESQVSKKLVALPENYLDALKALVQSEEQKELIAKERDFAIETKAHISDKKTATAMATASVKSKEAEKLKEQLGESKNYASVKAVESKVGGKYNWRELKKWCVANGKKIKDIADANYGTVKIYHKDAWNAVYGIKLTDLFSS
ncbi:Rha family transcriptional regulator [Acinetobacter sp. ANC5681]|uniref:Rha family transcriptional regulator n=1 Tax=Acinetobacter sp. ANC5681 TaxID=2929504 RepID=UPI00201AD92F|nr:Rha family transcriptional regulator [Acinetobacter sp. ANC5681]MCL5767344.1 Rha family transcriptional regulator [Acinetobacter sp. ANC5681]